MNLTSRTTYELADQPEADDADITECVHCGRIITRPVFLSNNGQQAQPYGSGCAAELLGLIDDTTTKNALIREMQRRAMVARQYAEMRAERVAYYGAALDAWNDGDRCFGPKSFLGRAITSFHEMKRRGYDGTVPEFLELVSRVGEFPTA